MEYVGFGLVDPSAGSLGVSEIHESDENELHMPRQLSCAMFSTSEDLEKEKVGCMPLSETDWKSHKSE